MWARFRKFHVRSQMEEFRIPNSLSLRARRKVRAEGAQFPNVLIELKWYFYCRWNSITLLSGWGILFLWGYSSCESFSSVGLILPLFPKSSPSGPPPVLYSSKFDSLHPPLSFPRLFFLSFLSCSLPKEN